MSKGTKKKAVDRLITLGAELRTAYGKASDHVADVLSPLESAVAEIGETWPPQHLAELARTDDLQEPERSPACFMHETFTNGEEAEYVLCVARNQDRTCGLHVSVCKSYRIHSNNGGDKVMVKDKRLLLPEKLPVPLRLRVLDVLDDFAEAYELHVRDMRSDVLEKWGENCPSEVVTEPPPKQSAAKDKKSKTKSKEKTEEKSKADPAPEPEDTETNLAPVPDPMAEAPDDAKEAAPELEPEPKEEGKRIISLDPAGEAAYKPGEAFVLNAAGNPVASNDASDKEAPDAKVSLKAWF